MISSLGAGIAILSILFLPVAGCMEYNITGLEILSKEEIEPESKLYIIAAIGCGILIFFLANRIGRAVSAIGGGISLFIAYFIAHAENELIEMRAGAIIAILSYTAIAILNFTTSERTLDATTAGDSEVVP